jgi:ribosomal-protein-alanine N-acetyltransferase
MIELCPVLESHAPALFPLVFRTSVVDTLVWNGPESLEEFQQAMREREEQTRSGLLHRFTILNNGGIPVGAIDIRPEYETSASIGLWIGAQYHGLGYGTEAVRRVVRRGFEEMNIERIYARVFIGNMASRRIFEKNGFVLEGTLRHVVRKRGVFLDAWILAIIREDYERCALGR